VSGRSRAESQVGVRLMGVWRVSYSNIQEFFFQLKARAKAKERRAARAATPASQKQVC
jgi:hypothetical protein